MKVSVAIPVRNGSATIQATLDSVLRQTVAPDEILVMDDGSTDNTASLASLYEPRVTVFKQENQGVAGARNVLIKKAQGDLIAFLDADDIWHPSYLEVQRRLFADYPAAVALFTGHVNFDGYGTYLWESSPLDISSNVEVIDPLNFSRRYNETTGPFASMSYCCIPKRVLGKVGSEPFSVKVSGADDYYLFNILPLLGSVVYASAPLVAYRVTSEAQSANRLRGLAWSVGAFELLQTRYRELAETELSKAFGMAFASKRRQYAKLLMGAGKTLEAREQLWRSLGHSRNPESLAKSVGFLFLTYMPAQLQPTWPSSRRQIDSAQTP